jgi:hypothetical protein
VRNLCEEAPEAARFLATTILGYSDANSYLEDSIESPQPGSGNDITQPTKRKSASSKDLSYRPPKAAKAKAENNNILDQSGQSEDGSKSCIDDSAHAYVSDIQSPTQDKGVADLQDEDVEMHEAKSKDGVDVFGNDVFWLFKPQVILRDNECAVVCDRMKGESTG